MASTNTEKPTSKAEKKKTAPVAKESPAKKPVQTPKEKVQADKPKVEDKSKVENKPNKEEKKKEIKVPKKEIVVANARSLPISTKVAVAISKFIKGKSIDNAIADLQQVAKLKKAVPMKGEIAHRKGKMMSGKYPEKAAREVLPLLKSLKSNSIQHDLQNPIIVESVSNIAQRPYAKGGRARKKATHLKIVAKEKKVTKQTKKKQ